jgi:hypothetical protein
MVGVREREQTGICIAEKATEWPIFTANVFTCSFPSSEKEEKVRLAIDTDSDYRQYSNVRWTEQHRQARIPSCSLPLACSRDHITMDIDPAHSHSGRPF